MSSSLCLFSLISFPSDYDETAMEIIVNEGLLPVLKDIVKRKDQPLHPDTLYHALMAVITFTSGTIDQTNLIAQDTELMARFHEILTATYEEEWHYKIRYHIIIAYGNIAGSSKEHRDLLLSDYNVYETILAELILLYDHITPIVNYICTRKQYFVDQTLDKVNLDVLPKPLQYALDQLTYLRNLVWAIRNIYRLTPRPHFHIRPNDRLMEVLSSFYLNIDDKDVLRDVSYCFTSMCMLTQNHSINLNYVKNLSSLFIRMKSILFNSNFTNTSAFPIDKTERIEVYLPILKLLTAISGSDHSQHTELIINIEFLIPFYQFLQDHYSSSSRKSSDDSRLLVEAVIIIGNGLVSSPSCRREILKTKFIPYIIELYYKSKQENIKKEVIWALGALVALGGNDAYMTNISVEIQKCSFDPKNVTVAQNERVIQLIMMVIKFFRLNGYDELARLCVSRLYIIERDTVQVFMTGKKIDDVM